MLWPFKIKKKKKIIVSGDYSDTQVENGQFVQEHLAGEKYIVLKSLVEKLEVLGNWWPIAEKFIIWGAKALDFDNTVCSGDDYLD